MALLPFNISYIVLTPRRVRLPGELSFPATPEKPRYVMNMNRIYSHRVQAFIQNYPYHLGLQCVRIFQAKLNRYEQGYPHPGQLPPQIP